MSYYDVDAILTDSQKLPCTFELDVPGLGYLDGNAGQTIKAGSKIDLPMWLGILLAVSSGNTPGATPLVSLDFPEPLQQRVINALKADPKSVDLRVQAPHFYALGARIMDLFEDQDVLDTLVDTFKQRAAEIADHAHHARGALGEGAEFLRGLDESERQIFKAAHEGSKAVRVWTQDLKKNT
ncbi:DNA replication complex GINS protein psf3 [Exophiala aquamarina CBS 119918]|uniref:DNA replication complex GINS protein PSF3 n=1 Tax=Exophiala aquamarina CBS 119918 TaxID=1182545 RepID=A0A072PPT0_9EURO|nr:DNA replication complex GINS protein psf3 [Exophiala aquamarina CBS 119918]KEF57525.1 DNA replication complex GINS protein psf3 [Exophiala aquamarina CBS 119918]